MLLQTVESSMIQAVGYDETLQTLRVVFNNGRVYEYLQVPPAVYTELMKADSKGRYLHSLIIDQYPYRQVRQ